METNADEPIFTEEEGLVITDEQLAGAETEANAQATIIQALKRVGPERRQPVLEAVWLLLEADRKVPGTLALFTRRRKRQE